MQRARIGSALLIVGALAVPSCRAATELTVVVSTDVTCADLRGTSITVGNLHDIETKAATTTSTVCDASGALGTLVIVPSGGKSDEVAVKVVAGLGRDPETCVPPYGKGCIVARRALHYVVHTGLRISVPLRAACDGVPCGETQTCVSGQCVGATIADPSACTGGGCGEEVLAPAGADGGVGPGGGPDAGPDAGVDAALPGGGGTYADLTQVTSWSTFDTSTVSAQAGGFSGAVFDGRYVYLVPHVYNAEILGVVARYDTQASFGTATSWTTFDAQTLASDAKGFLGGVFDGRYLYLVPNVGVLVTRYDTQASFTAAASWTTFDVTNVSANAFAFDRAVFDGRYVYFSRQAAATSPAVVVRFDTQGTLTNVASWSTFNVATASAGAKAFAGSVFDGRYVHLVPYDGVAARYDTQGAFSSAGSWTTFDQTTVSAGAKGFQGGAFDGRYVYFVPSIAGSAQVTRYDTQGGYGASGSWSVFDARSTNAAAQTFTHAAFDGRNVYFVGPSTGVTRYDTQASFANASAWSTFDVTRVNGAAGVFAGAAFDGRYLYLAPGTGSTVARFDAKSPPSMPTLPAFFGAFP